MKKKIIIPIIIVGVVAVVIVVFMNVDTSVSEINPDQNETQKQETENVPDSITLRDGNNIATITSDQIVDLSSSTDLVKEISMTSFTEVIDGKHKPQFSKKEIVVNKGDKVRIKITVTSGMHDFKIDEFNVYTDTKELNKEYVVEFTADKAGEFTYYCAKPGHRQNGHWGTIKVLDK